MNARFAAPLRRLGRFNWMLIASALFAAGCTTAPGVRFKNVLAPPLPYVLAGADGQYKVSAIVLNNSDDAVATGRIELAIRAWYNTLYAPTQCQKDFVRTNPHLAANGEWHVLNVEFDAGGSPPGDPCACRTSSQCKGVVWLTLRRASTDVTLPGPRTYMAIKFDGPLVSQITVTDLSE